MPEQVTYQPVFQLTKERLEDWVSSDIIRNTKDKYYALIRIENEETGEWLNTYKELDADTIPLSHHCIKYANKHESLMQHYFTDYILHCLLTSPLTPPQEAIISFFKNNREKISEFIENPGSKLDEEWHYFDPIFTLKEIRGFVGYIHERTKELTYKLKDQGIKTDLLVNMSTMLHNLESLYWCHMRKCKKKA